MSAHNRSPSRISRRTPHFAVASGFYSGCFSPSPGTAGSLACVAAWLIVAPLGVCTAWPCGLFLAALALAIGLGVTKSCLAEMRTLGEDAADPQFVVIDEWAGMLIPLAFVSIDEPIRITAAFALFRLFDIAKPWPVSAAERLPGEWGVMADDIVAGILAAAVLYGSSFLPL